MKRVIVSLLVLTLLLGCSVSFSAQAGVSEQFVGYSYEEYFSEERNLSDRTYKYAQTDMGNSSSESPSYLNGEYVEGYNGIVVHSDVRGYRSNNTSVLAGAPEGSLFIEKSIDGERKQLFVGSGFRVVWVTTGYFFTASKTEMRRWNLSTLESEVIVTYPEGTSSFLYCYGDELTYYRINNKLYRYYAPTKTTEYLCEHERFTFVLPGVTNQRVSLTGSTVDYFTYLKRGKVEKGLIKDIRGAYLWANERFGLNLELPSEEYLKEVEESGKYESSEMFITYTVPLFETQEIVLVYNAQTGEVLGAEHADSIPHVRAFQTGELNYPDVASPWLGDDVAGAPEALNGILAQIPTGAFWGEVVNGRDVVYTSMGNNRDRALLKEIMERRKITRPEKRELLDLKYHSDKERIPATEVKATFEALYGPGSSDGLETRRVIGDANAGDMLLNMGDGTFVYCWAPYAGSALNAEQRIAYLDSFENGDTLEVYTAYGFYRYDDGRETYKLYGDARGLRFLEYPVNEPILTGTAGDGTLERLHKGELDDQLPAYKHTFVRNENGGYYWASSEPVDRSEIVPPVNSSTGEHSAVSSATDAPSDGTSSLWIYGTVGGGVILVVLAVTAILLKKRNAS